MSTENDEIMRRLASPALSNLAPAFVKAWGEIGAGVTRNASNPHFGNNYADLAACCTLIKPVLAKHGLAFLQSPGDLVGDSLTIIGLLLHTSGESITFKTTIPIGGKLGAQPMGSATTYGRRYQLKAIFCLADKDDDGEAATAEPDDAELEVAIDSAKSIDDLEKLRPRVEQCDDETVRKLYLSKRRALRAK